MCASFQLLLQVTALCTYLYVTLTSGAVYFELTRAPPRRVVLPSQHALRR